MAQIRSHFGSSSIPLDRRKPQASRNEDVAREAGDPAEGAPCSKFRVEPVVALAVPLPPLRVLGIRVPAGVAAPPQFSEGWRLPPVSETFRNRPVGE